MVQVNLFFELSLHVSMFYNTVFHFLEHFFEHAVVSRELNRPNLIGLQWLYHCWKNSSSHFPLLSLKISEMVEIVPIFRPKHGDFGLKHFFDRSWLMFEIFNTKTLVLACFITNYVSPKWTYQGCPNEIDTFLCTFVFF